MIEEYRITPGGLAGELQVLNIDEVILHLEKHLQNFLLDPAVIICYINRFAKDKEINNNKAAVECLAYLSRKCLLLKPFELTCLEMYLYIFGSLPDMALYAYIKKQDNNNYWQRKSNRLLNDGPAQAIDVLSKYFDRAPDNLILADILLHLHMQEGLDLDPIAHRVAPPPPFQAAWGRRLFLAYAAVNAVPQALALLERFPLEGHDEVVLNHAAEIMVKCGKTDMAVAFYQASLEADPRQMPVRRRLRELLSPTRPDTRLLASDPINVYLYSFNKAQLLSDTLESLSRCDLGPAKIKVLLNGCTDDSLAVVEKARMLFGQNPLEVIALPVNIGAPAARNWLIAAPDTRQAAHTVFLDDDVLLQPDFLHHFLTAAKSRPKYGVVGCKTLFPGRYPRYQYLYRNISVAQPGLLRISLDTPNSQYDNNLYDFVRGTANVMGCCHMLSHQALQDVPTFDLCFSPTQMDDIAHDFDLALKGYAIVYCGLVACVHRQMTGNLNGNTSSAMKLGNLMGNDVKFYYRFCDRLGALAALGGDDDGLGLTAEGAHLATA